MDNPPSGLRICTHALLLYERTIMQNIRRIVYNYTDSDTDLIDYTSKVLLQVLSKLDNASDCIYKEIEELTCFQ